MTPEQNKVLDILQQENTRATKSGLPYVKDATLFEPLCEIAPIDAIKRFNKSYKLIIKEGDKAFSKDTTEKENINGKVQLLCWELYFNSAPFLNDAEKSNAMLLLDNIFKNMEYNRRPLVYMSESKLTQFATKTISRNTHFQGNLDGTGEYIEGRVNSKNYLMAVIEDFKKSSAVTAQTLKLFVYLHEIYGNTHTRELRLDIDEWLKRQGKEDISKNDRDNARRTIKNQLRLLAAYKFRGEPTKSKGSYLDVALIGTHGCKNNVFTIYLDEFYEKTLKNNAPLITYDTIYKLGTETQIKILLKLGWNYRMNEGAINRDPNKLSVKSTLEFCGYPKLETIKEHKQSPIHKIMKPFLSDLKALQETDDQLYFSFINSDGEEYTLDEAEMLDFDEFYNTLYLYFDQYGHLPQNKKRIAAKKSYTQQNKEAKKTKSSKKSTDTKNKK